jgi:hypothetical protein
MKLSLVKNAAKTKLLLLAIFCSLLASPQTAVADPLLTVTNRALNGIVTPAAGAAPILSITPTDEYTGTISWSTILNEADPVPLVGNFEAGFVHQAVVTLTATDLYTFEGVTENFFTVPGAHIIRNPANQGVVTIIYNSFGEEQPNIDLSNLIDQSFGSNGLFDVRDFFGKNPFTASGSSATSISIDRIAVDSADRIVALASFKVEASGTAVGTGYRNSINIAAQSGNETSTAAAVMARSYSSTFGGAALSDWYLPSKNELNQLCKWVKGITGGPLTNLTTQCAGGSMNSGTGAIGFSADRYWSSTEDSNSDAWAQSFSLADSNPPTAFFKEVTSHIRPIRSGTVTNPVIGAQGPGGGSVFYTSETLFDCGPRLELTCNYLEAAPSNWNAGDSVNPEDTILTWATGANQTLGIAIDNHILFRLDPDGLYDSSFGTAGKFLRKNLNDQIKPYVLVATTKIDYRDEVVKLLIDSDDRILVLLSGSIANSNSGAYHNFIARYINDGAIDTSFGDGGDGAIGTTAAQSDQPTTPLYFADFALDSSVQDGIIVAGFPVMQDDDPEVMLQRFNSSGVLDAGFGTSGVARSVLNFPIIFEDAEFSETRYSKIQVIADPLNGYIVAHNDFSEHFVSEDPAVASSFSLFTQLLRFKSNGLFDLDFQLAVPGFSFTNNTLQDFALTDIAADALLDTPSGFLLSGAYVSTLSGPSEDFESVVLKFAISEATESDEEISTDILIWTSEWDSQGCVVSDSVRFSSQTLLDGSVFTGTFCPLDSVGTVTALSPEGASFQTIGLEPTEDNFALQIVNQIVPTNSRDLLFLRGSRPSSGWLSILDAAFDTPDDNWTSATISRLLLQGPEPEPEPEPELPATPTPVPYLRALTTPKINIKDGKLLCTPGTYNAGYTLNGVIQGSATTLFTPSSFIYNHLIDGVAQTSLALTSSSTSNFWDMPASTSGSLITCSVTVTANGVTKTDRSSDNSSAVSSALSTQAIAASAAEAEYVAAKSTNSKAYPKALVDNRAKWRAEIAAIRANYYEVLARINAESSSRKMISDKSTALKIMITAQRKSAADYKASKPAALAAKDAADKAALDAKNTAIAKANAVYGTFIESIGYGVLIP